MESMISFYQHKESLERSSDSVERIGCFDLEFVPSCRCVSYGYSDKAVWGDVCNGGKGGSKFNMQFVFSNNKGVLLNDQSIFIGFDLSFNCLDGYFVVD